MSTSSAGPFDAEVAEVKFTAFTGRRWRDHVTARLIVRRVRRLNPHSVAAGQTEAFVVYRYMLFTDSAESMLSAEASRRAMPSSSRSSPS